MKQGIVTCLRRGAVALTALFCLTLAAVPVSAAPELDKNTAVNDYADILSAETEAYVENLSVALQDTCGAQIGVYTTEYIGNSTMEGYAYDVLNTWGLGSADKNNGVLLLLVPGEDNYYLTRGSGLEAQLTISMLGTILDENLEPSWLEQDYDTGTQKTVRALAERLCSIYGIPVSTLDNAGQAAAPDHTGGGINIMGIFLIIVAVILVLALVSSLRRPRGPRPPRGGGFGSGLFWYSMGRASRRPRRPPPPPPGGFGGPGPGYGAPRPPRGPSRPMGGSRPGRPGGMGRPGGAPRSGGFRPGGGSSRGGGVGRRG